MLRFIARRIPLPEHALTLARTDPHAFAPVAHTLTRVVSAAAQRPTPSRPQQRTEVAEQYWDIAAGIAAAPRG